MKRFAKWAAVLRSPSSSARSPSSVRKEAEAARDEGRWREAVDLFSLHARLRPKRIGTWIQLGNMHKQAGDPVAAAIAYRKALDIRPTVEAWTHLGQLHLTHGRIADALSAFEAGLGLVPDHHQAREGLISAGGRDRLPFILGAGDFEGLSRLRALIHDFETAIHDAASQRIVPLAFYDKLRKVHEVQPPPGLVEAAVEVSIDARGVSPDRIRSSLNSLEAQALGTWVAYIQVDETILDHPVASRGMTDPRVKFHLEEMPSEERERLVLTMAPGSVLAPDALTWLLFALDKAAARVVYCDHDHLVETWPQGDIHEDPVFFAAPDSYDLNTALQLPVVALWSLAAGEPLPSWRNLHDRRRRLAHEADLGNVANLPLVLVSEKKLSPQARAGLPAPGEGGEFLEESVLLPAPSHIIRRNDHIRIIIPTRDEHRLLSACINSLRERARQPDRLKIVVVDNRSLDRETHGFLEDGRRKNEFSTLSFDEPFNWARINNLASKAASEEHLLFLNNDTEVLTPDWDDRLCGHLSDEQVGIVGARLLYEDRTLQHGGVVLGLGSGTPRHEGVGADEGNGGPGARWKRVRAVSAVTGAFMAVRRETHMALGGFDELNFPIAYNDIDYCLSARQRGLKVLYAADIEALHYESRTRGMNSTRAKVAWDLSELTSLKQKWGDFLLQDPAVNPHWNTGSQQLFDGVVPVSQAEAVAWIDQGRRR